ncbi:MAG TPA: secondary thiamine-phosphate synthase enzyme YjbQ [Tepidiformaceae bacterium]|nr:secondary thiamine-phosphate synthase enzyme YjbQ [Tepidiformaceae bacterium]
MFHAVLEVRSSSREELRDITPEVSAAVRESGASDGIVTLFVPHTTAAVTVNENVDPDVRSDMIGWLARLVPRDAPFRHAEGNSDAHLKASLVGPSVQIPLVSGQLRLGTWQGIYFCEFDGPRPRQIEVLITSG